MSFLDFIKNRQTQTQPAAAPSQPETAKEMYSREAAQEQAAVAKPANELRPQDSAPLERAQQLYQKATQEVSHSPAVPAPAQTEGATSPQAMVQMASNQDKEAPALSPTSAQKGARANEKEGPPADKENPTKSPDQTNTMARRPPSWER